MNCKPGDLAFVVGLKFDAFLNGSIVEVLGHVGHLEYAELPDGHMHEAGEYGDWAVKFSREVTCTTSHDGVHFSRYGVINDRNLRPIRNQPGEDETLQWIPVPGQKVEVPA